MMSNGEHKDTLRINGFQRPWHLLQIATWFLYPVLLAHYYVFLYALLWDHMAVRVVITIFFSFCSVIALFAAYQTCAINPADDAVIDKNNENNETGRVYCYLCETHVYFLTLVWSVGGITTTSLVLCSVYFVEVFVHTDSFQIRIDAASFWLSRDLVIGVLAASLAVMIALVAMVFQLLGFHLMLAWKGMTTYDFIVYEQRRQREALAARATRKSRKSNSGFNFRKGLKSDKEENDNVPNMGNSYHNGHHGVPLPIDVSHPDSPSDAPVFELAPVDGFLARKQREEEGLSYGGQGAGAGAGGMNGDKGDSHKDHS